MRYYPLFLDIAGRLCVVVGGGKVAQRKVERLLACGARVAVVGERFTAGLKALAAQGAIVRRGAGYEAAHIRDAYLVIGATDDEGVNGRIAADARALGIPVNIADEPARCDFILPSLVERGALTIAVSTAGKSPALAKKLRRELEAAYGGEYAVLLHILGKLREKVMAKGRSSAENRKKFEAVLASPILEMIRGGQWREVRALIRELTGVDMEVKPR